MGGVQKVQNLDYVIYGQSLSTGCGILKWEYEYFLLQSGNSERKFIKLRKLELKKINHLNVTFVGIKKVKSF